jgi:Na+-driven multidrug efflux pump
MKNYPFVDYSDVCLFAVVSWVLLCVVWKVLEASNEGIGEAAAVRVAYHLGTEYPNKAKLSAYKAVFVSVVHSLLVACTLFMLGKYLATWLTTDLTLQHMFNDVLALLGLGSVFMSYRMISWSLVGAQGRYRLAALVILLSRWLVTIPIADVFVYGLTLDLNSIMASIIVGSEAGCMALAYVLLRSDWERLSCIMQDINSIVDMDADDAQSTKKTGDERWKRYNLIATLTLIEVI